MLRLLSIRHFVVVDALELEFGRGFSVLTGETGAGKSILLDALALLLGDRFETRQIQAGRVRAELAAEFDVAAGSELAAWADERGYAIDAGTMLLRRTLDADGRSRAWINGQPATLADLKDAGERLVDLNGQHGHQALVRAEFQRALLDAYGSATDLARETAVAWRAWQKTIAERDAAARIVQAGEAEREEVEARIGDLEALAMAEDEWPTLEQQQSRLAHLAALEDAATSVEAALDDEEDSLVRRLDALIAKLERVVTHDAALDAPIALLKPARAELAETARGLRDYRRKLEVDPREIARVEERMRAIHELARRHRVRPAELPALLVESRARREALVASGDLARLEQSVEAEAARFRERSAELTAKRRRAAIELGARVTATMQRLAMEGGRFSVMLVPLPAPSGIGAEQVEMQVAAHRGQPPGPLARVASGGELSRIALAIVVVASEVAAVPTLVFDEVDAGIGGGVAATVGELLHSLGRERQVLCVTHLPQVAAFADAHFRVSKQGGAKDVHATVVPLDLAGRVDELARMLAGASVTPKARAHARELLKERAGGA